MDTRTSYNDAFMTSLHKLKRSRFMTDIKLILPDQSTIDCHKLVLATASPFFKTMFQSGLKESTQPEVHLDFTDSDMIRKVVDYFYSGEIDINSNNVDDIVTVSEFLCLADLKNHCGAFMTSQVNSSNCLEFYRCARLYSLGKLVPHCFEYILSHFHHNFCSSESFVDLSEEELIEVVSDDRLAAENEDIVFHSLLRWVEADRQKRKEAFVRIAPFIRFPFCTPGVLSQMGYETLMMNKTCMDLFHEAINISSPLICLHSLHSARSVPRHEYKTKKPRLLQVFARKKASFCCQFTEQLDGERTKWNKWHFSRVGGYGWEGGLMKINDVVLSLEGIHVMTDAGQHALFDVENSTETTHYKGWVMPQRSDFSLAYIQDKFFAFGGKINGQPCTIVDSFDQQTQQWKPQPQSMLQAVCKPYIGHFVTKVYVLGGIAADGPMTSNQEFDPIWGKWQTKQKMPGVCQSGAAVSFNTNIFVVGGVERVCFRYTPATDTWAVLSQPTQFHTISTTATAWSGNILLCGGDHGEEYNPDTEGWSPCDALVPKENPRDPVIIMLLCSTFK